MLPEKERDITLVDMRSPQDRLPEDEHQDQDQEDQASETDVHARTTSRQ
jgi:hypothetical protein